MHKTRCADTRSFFTNRPPGGIATKAPRRVPKTIESMFFLALTRLALSTSALCPISPCTLHNRWHVCTHWSLFPPPIRLFSSKKVKWLDVSHATWAQYAAYCHLRLFMKSDARPVRLDGFSKAQHAGANFCSFVCNVACCVHPFFDIFGTCTLPDLLRLSRRHGCLD